ncbi:CDP-alcohol phosphatidyltransferase family protein [Candidatus Saccharibacteria bacterium]|nr:CDP-alcohol phosphatidyltransferase family protein [Candidatus Saccharibacteria bacterium]
MRFLADILTLTRFILSIVLIILSFIGCPAEVVFTIFLIAEFTDTFDGTCARKWPFPKDKTPKYRKYAAQFDIVSDVLLAAGQVLFCTLQVNVVVGIVVIVYYVLICGVLEFILYGKLFGHPDNCTKNSLTKRNFPLAKKIVLTRRYLYTICLGVVNAFILFATNWPTPVKYGLFIFGCSIFVFVWFFLRQRRKNISRDAIEIENELTKKAKTRR